MAGNPPDHRPGAVRVTGLAHWQVSQDAEGIVWAACDREGEATNALSEAVIAELDRVLDGVETALAGERPPAGLVITSAKPASFILGADIREFDAFGSAEAVSAKIRDGHAV